MTAAFDTGANSEAQRLRAAIEAHKHAMREYKGAEFDLELWKALEETAYDEAGGQAGWVTQPLPGGE